MAYGYGFGAWGSNWGDPWGERFISSISAFVVVGFTQLSCTPTRSLASMVSIPTINTNAVQFTCSASRAPSTITASPIVTAASLSNDIMETQ